MTERVVNEELLNAPLTAVNYKDKFLHLNELEMHEHEQCLERWALMLILAACMLCNTYSTVGKSIAQGDTFTKVWSAEVNIPPRLYIEAMDWPTVLYTLYSMVRVQETNPLPDNPS